MCARMRARMHASVETNTLTPSPTPCSPSPGSDPRHKYLGIQADTGSRPEPFRCDGHRIGSHGGGSLVHSAGNPELRDKIGELAGVPNGGSTPETW